MSRAAREQLRASAGRPQPGRAVLENGATAKRRQGPEFVPSALTGRCQRARGCSVHTGRHRGAAVRVPQRCPPPGPGGRRQEAGTPGWGAPLVPDLGDRPRLAHKRKQSSRDSSGSQCRGNAGGHGGHKVSKCPQVCDLLQVPKGWSSSSTNK